MTAMSTLDELVANGDQMPRFDDDMANMQELIRTMAEALVNEIMSAQADELCDSSENTRNGYRERKITTCVGTITMRIPKLRIDPYFPDELIERYSRVDRAVVATIAEMYVPITFFRCGVPQFVGAPFHGASVRACAQNRCGRARMTAPAPAVPLS